MVEPSAPPALPRLPPGVRPLFAAHRGRVYLQHAGYGPPSLRVADAVARAAVAVTTRLDWEEDYLADAAAARTAAARLLGARAHEIVLTRGTAHGLSLLARGLDWRPGDNLVVAPGEFPTNIVPWTTLRRRGVDVRLARSSAAFAADSVWSCVDGRTRVVAIALVQFWSGYRNDLAQLADVCRREGVVVAADGAQAVGAIRVDVKRLGVDLLAAPADKWLLGGCGAGICFVNDRLADRLEPPLVGTASVVTDAAQPFAQWTTYRDGAARFAEPALSWYDVAATLAALRLALEVGHETIERRVLGLARCLGNALADLGFAVVGPWPRHDDVSSGIVSFRDPRSTPASICSRLAAAGVVARPYRDFVRLSPHYYNTTAELRRALGALRSPRDCDVSLTRQ